MSQELGGTGSTGEELYGLTRAVRDVCQHVCSDEALRTGAVSDSVSRTTRKSLRMYLNIHKPDSECHLPGNRL